MHEYETTFIIDSLLKNEEIEGIISKYERFISANGGEIVRIDRWGKKRLAFEINKRQYGYYVYIRYSGPPTVVKPLEREFRLNESILRYLSIRLDSKMLKHEQHKESQTMVSKTSQSDQAIELKVNINNNEKSPKVENSEGEEAKLKEISDSPQSNISQSREEVQPKTDTQEKVVEESEDEAVVLVEDEKAEKDPTG